MKYPCPECGSGCAWTNDCPGYGSPVKICYEPYHFWIGRKSIRAMACGNAALWYCTDEECKWQYRIPNKRSDAKGVRPDWMYNPT